MRFHLVTKCAVFLLLVLSGSAVYAQEFNPNKIIDDAEMEDYTSMTLSDIYTFLQEKNSYLVYYLTPDYDGITRTASEIIWLASLRYQINPKYTLALLQKEQSLIENPTPTERDLNWATGYGICDSCATGDTDVQKYKGFGKQIDNGVGFMRYFFDNPEKTAPFNIGIAVSVNDKVNGSLISYTIIPENQTTANLYKYTPHYSGNLSLWKIWQNYFQTSYPDGSLIKLKDKSTVWLIQNGKKRSFKSYGILTSRHNPKRIVEISEEDLNAFPDGHPISFPQYSYLRSPNDEVYLIVDDTRHKFESKEALRILGVNPEEITDVTPEELGPYKDGKPLSPQSAYPTGALLQNKNTGGVYYVENGDKFPLWSKEIMKERYPNKRMIKISEEELEKYPTGSPITFSDGTLVKDASSPTVYVISNGTRRPLSSEVTFKKLGYSWNAVITTSAEAIAIHPLGTPI